MPADHDEEFDESTSSGGPYYLQGQIVRIDGSLYRVSNIRRIEGTRKRAWLEYLDTPSADERGAATEWTWDADRQVMCWMPVQW